MTGDDPSLRPLKVLLLFPHFNTLDQASSLRSWQIGRFLAHRGHDVTVLAPGVDLRSGDLFPEMRGRVFATSYVEGVRLIRVRSLTHFRRSAGHRLTFEVVFALLSSLRALTVRGIDAMVVAYPPAVAPFFGFVVGRLRRWPVAFEVRDLLADNLKSTKYVRSSVFARIAKGLEKQLARRSDHVIPVSNGIKKFLVADGCPPEKITVAKNGYEPEVFAGVDYSQDIRSEFGWGERFVVVYAGGLTQAYDIPTLLRAAERLRSHEDLLFAIIGEGDRKAEYQRHCAKRGLDNCQFIGYQPRRRMPAILSAANVGVHMFNSDPLWAYVLGNKPFDYLGSGLPMVFAGMGDTAELVLESGGGLVVTPEADDELADALLRMKQDPDSARAMGERGRDHVRTHYDRWRLLEDFELALYRTMGIEAAS